MNDTTIPTSLATDELDIDGQYVDLQVGSCLLAGNRHVVLDVTFEHQWTYLTLDEVRRLRDHLDLVLGEHRETTP